MYCEFDFVVEKAKVAILSDRTGLDKKFCSRYELHRLIGEGVFGFIVSAYDNKRQKPVILSHLGCTQVCSKGLHRITSHQTGNVNAS